jgi:hypothetical protein
MHHILFFIAMSVKVFFDERVDDFRDSETDSLLEKSESGFFLATLKRIEPVSYRVQYVLLAAVSHDAVSHKFGKAFDLLSVHAAHFLIFTRRARLLDGLRTLYTRLREKSRK